MYFIMCNQLMIVGVVGDLKLTENVYISHLALHGIINYNESEL